MQAKANSATTDSRNLSPCYYLAGLITHPYARLPDFLKGGTYEQGVASIYNSTYWETLSQLNIDLKSTEPLVGERFIEAITPYYKEYYQNDPDPELALDVQIDKAKRLKSRQQVSLWHRVNSARVALRNVVGKDSVVREGMFSNMLNRAAESDIDDNITFQRMLFRLGNRPNPTGTRAIVASTIKRINTVI